MKHFVSIASLATLLAVATFVAAAPADAASIKPGDAIAPDNAALVSDLVSPGNFILVRQGMQMKIVASDRLEWPPPYKSATEKYAAQTSLNAKGEVDHYVAGLPFPLLDPNDPQAATKVMWNFSFRPQYSDDVDIRGELRSRRRDLRAGRTLHHRALRLLQQHGPHGGRADADRSGGDRPRNPLPLRRVPVS